MGLSPGELLLYLGLELRSGADLGHCRLGSGDHMWGAQRHRVVQGSGSEGPNAPHGKLWGMTLPL